MFNYTIHGGENIYVKRRLNFLIRLIGLVSSRKNVNMTDLVPGRRSSSDPGPVRGMGPPRRRSTWSACPGSVDRRRGWSADPLPPDPGNAVHVSEYVIVLISPSTALFHVFIITDTSFTLIHHY